ncbi:MAG TPA: IPT/TIG domain-containing protein [Terriglobia bacterium]|nr:IPT/TIG domain-containing protein [Terriglobia bacterium]
MQSNPPAVLAESALSVTLTAQVVGTLPGESTAVRWTRNDVQVSTSSTVGVSPSDGTPGLPLIMKATSVFDPTKFAAVPVIGLESATLAQIAFPNAVAYHPATGKLYVVALVPSGTSLNSQIVEVGADGAQSAVITFSNEAIEKLVPYQSGGTAYLLALAYANGMVRAVNLQTRTSRNVVTGLQTPISAGLHPVTGDLYIAEQTARRISRVGRQALEAAVSGSSAAGFQSLPVTISNISGVGFVADRETRTVSLIASTTDGLLYGVNLADNTFSVVATNLRVAQEPLVVHSATLGFSFVLTASSLRTGSTIVDGQGQVLAATPGAAGQPFHRTYTMAGQLDGVADLAFIPAGTPYGPGGGALIVAANSSATANRGKIVRWELPSNTQQSFFAYNDRAQPSATLLAPADGASLTPGAPLEIRVTVTDANPANPPNTHFPSRAEVQLSTDGGASYSSVSPSLLASGPQGSEYSFSWQVPASLAGQVVRLKIQMAGLDGTTFSSAGSGEMQVLGKGAAPPLAIAVNPNFVLAGESAEITVDGLNLQEGTTLSLDDSFTVALSGTPSATRLAATVSVPALAEPGPRALRLCNGAMNCGETGNAFFALPDSAPRITALQPSSGAPGTSVRITGANFSPVAANNVVHFGHLLASVSQAQPGALDVQVPFGLNWGKATLRVETNGVASNTADFVLLPPGVSYPAINRDGIVNAASYAPGSTPLAAGSIGSAFGTRLASSIAGATEVPLPRELLNATLLIGGIAAPLFFAAPNQINFQLPEELRGLSSAPAAVLTQGLAGNTVLLNLASQNPALFSANGTGTGPGAVLNQDGTPNGASNPERIGRVLQVFANGLGEAVPSVPTGFAAQSDPLSVSIRPPEVTIDGKPAARQFSGRAPSAVGLDQINVTIPEGVRTGMPVPLVISAGEKVSNTVTVFIAP